MSYNPIDNWRLYALRELNFKCLRLSSKEDHFETLLHAREMSIIYQSPYTKGRTIGILSELPTGERASQTFISKEESSNLSIDSKVFI